MMFEYLRGQESPWSAYFSILPATFNTLMFWSDEELAELKGSAVVKKIGKESADAAIKENIFPLVRANPRLFPAGGGMTSWDTEEGEAALLGLAHRMGSLIMAYAFDIDGGDDDRKDDGEEWAEDDEDDPPKGMVPLADMLNADADRNNVCASNASSPRLADQLTT